jgi:putative ABC transport system permease protein
VRSIGQDIRYALRQLLRSPGFAVVSVLTLALGIGANTAIFTVVNASLLRALPYQNESRLLHLQETRAAEGVAQFEFDYPDFLDLRERAHSFEALAGYSGTPATYTSNDGAEVLPVTVVSANFFDVLGVRLAQGRTFQSNADLAGGERGVVLTYQGWQRRFGGEPGVMGRSLNFNGELYSVVGILPPDFQFIPGRGTDFYLPLEVSEWRLRRNAHWIYPIGRLKPGISRQAAQSEVSAIARQLEQQYSESNKNVGMLATPLREQMLGPVRPGLIVLMAAVVTVLLIACLNLAAMQLARSVSRQKEMSVRSALGASRGQILQLYFTESVVLAAIGGVLGLLLSASLLPLLVAGIPRDQMAMLPFLQGLQLDTRVLAFCAVMSALSGVVFGLAPALQGMNRLAIGSLQDGARSTGNIQRHSLRNSLIVCQIGMTIVLLVSAGLLLKSLNKLLHVDPGFTTARLLTFQTVVPQKKYQTRQQAIALEQNLRTRLQQLPGVQSVATSSAVSLTGDGSSSRFVVEGHPRRAEYEHEANGRDVSANYFSTMGIPLRAGRLFNEHDTMDATHVIVINQTLARMLASDGNMVGKRIDFTFTNEPVLVEVVGIVGDEQVSALGQDPAPVYYDPIAQSPSGSLGVMLRTTVEPMSLADVVRRTMREIDPELPVTQMASMDQIIQESPSALIRRYPAMMVGAFALLSLMLAAIGIYGLLAYLVAQRTRELGIRLALGAQRSSVLRLVIANGARLALLGAVIGGVASVAAGRLLASLLFQVSPMDVSIFAAVIFLLFGVVLLASYIPARRAAAIEPMQALRSE